MKAITVKELSNEDWKTQLARKYGNIPPNTEVEVIKQDVMNFYGSWCLVEYNGNRYYVDEKDLIFKEEK